MSVVIPVYNGERFLEEAVRSAANCLVREVIIVDDGSFDRTNEIIERLKSELSNLRSIWQENKGEGAALNRGLADCRTEYVVFLSADDILYPEGVVAQLNAHLVNPGLAATYPDWLEIDREGQTIVTRETSQYSRSELVGNLMCLPGPGSMIRVSSVRALKSARKENIRFWGDLDQWVRLSSIGSFERVPVVGAAWRRHDFNATHQARGEVLAQDLLEIRKSVEQDAPNLEEQLLNQFFARWHRLFAIALVQSKPISTSALHLLASFRFRSRLPKALKGEAWTLTEFLGTSVPFAGFLMSKIQEHKRRKTRINFSS